MNAIVICECSDTVTDALKAVGVNAHSCDFKPSEHGRPDHIQADCRTLDYSGINLVIAHPDCTRICNSGVSWLERRNLWKEMREAALFFKWCLDLPVDLIAVENPIPHKYAIEIIGARYTQKIQPYQFGEDASKATCLWLKGLPELIPTKIIPASHLRKTKTGIGRLVWDNQTGSGRTNAPPSDHRKADRARTYPGIAQAMAEQWVRTAK